jgi:hypothetical protein
MSEKKTETEELVTITRANYNQLVDDQYKLECLEAHGVDNWQGYSDAMADYHEEDE